MKKATIGMDRSVAVTGETGVGKTEFIKSLIYQMPYDGETAVIAHDHDDDYQRFFAELGLEPVRLRMIDGDARWNMFRDFDREFRYNEVASAMMGSPDGNDPFHQPAENVLKGILKFLHRRGKNQGVYPDHRHLYDMVNLPQEALYQKISDADDDIAKYASRIDPGGGRGRATTYDKLDDAVDKLLIGPSTDFARSGKFSLRDYLKNPGGRALVLDTPPEDIETVGPMFRLILDMAIRYSMGSETDVNLILDEIDALPKLAKLGDLASKGRSLGTRAVIGVQTIHQLTKIYGGDPDSNVLGNCPYGVYFSPGDKATAQHIRNEVGERMTTETSTSSSRSKTGKLDKPTTSKSESTRKTERNPITLGALNDFDRGDAVVVDQERWWMGHVAEFSEVRDRLPCGVPSGGPATGADTDDSGGWLRSVLGLDEDRGLTDSGRRRIEEIESR